MSESISWIRSMTGPIGLDHSPNRSGALEQRVTAVYLQSRGEIYRYVTAIGLDSATAQEVTQEAFLRLHAALCDRHTIRCDRAWLFTVAHNLALNTKARMLTLDELDPDLHSSPADGPERLLVTGERLKRVREAVESLSPQQRQCLELRAEGFRYREIAEILGLATSTVGEFLRRAMQQLRKAAPG
ncbi:MAG: RNA polymerase sigma factor [Bryobacteraceae bacterium]